MGVLDHFLAEERDQVEARRPLGVAAPFGEGGKGGSALCSEGLQGGQQQSAIADPRRWGPRLFSCKSHKC